MTTRSSIECVTSRHLPPSTTFSHPSHTYLTPVSHPSRPLRRWEIVTDPKLEVVESESYPERSGLREHQRQWCRRPVALKEMWARAEASINPRYASARLLPRACD